MEEALLKESSIGQKIESSNYTCDGWEEDESSLQLEFSFAYLRCLKFESVIQKITSVISKTKSRKSHCLFR